jgi:hypothetical protein
MFKKFIFKLLVSALLFIVPMQKSFAVAPLAIALVQSLAFHAGVLAIAFNNDPVSVNLPSGSGQPLTIYLDPNVPLITPSGWVGPVSPSTKPLPTSVPVSPSGYSSTSFPACGAFATDGSLGACAVSKITGPTGVSYTGMSSNPNSINFSSSNGVLTYSLTIICPTGYTLSGTTCNSSNPTIVRKPPNSVPCEIIRTGNTIAVDALNPACDSVTLPDGSKSAITANSITITHPDGSVDSVTLNPTTGGGTVVVSKPNSNGTTTTNTTDITAPSGAAGGGQSANPPTVGGQSGRTDNGTGSQAGSGSGTAAGAGGGTCTDCAKEVTLQATNGLLTTIKNSVDGASFNAPVGNNPTLDMQNGIDKMGVEPATPTISWTPSLLPGSAVACHPLPIDVGMTAGLLSGTSGSTTLDICNQLDIIRQILGYLLMVSTTVYVFRCFSTGNKGG